MEYLELNDGSEIPQLGFGTAGIGGHKKTKDVIELALDNGYRRIDTASMYRNERAIGDAIAASDIGRDQIFVVTKLWDGGNYSYDNTIAECKKSLDRLGLDYIDMYLHHWPVQGQRLESWDAMEQLVEDGLTHYIGVSNYTINHLNELIDHATIVPELNQVEFNPFLYQEDLMKYCQSSSVILEAYSPLAQGRKLDNEVLREVAETHDKSTVQVMLRWAVQHGLSVIPKASSSEHIRANVEIFDFELDKREMDKLNNLHQDLRLEWDPTSVK